VTGGGARGYYTGVKISYLSLCVLLVACSLGAQPAATPSPPTQIITTATPEPALLVLLTPPESDAQLATAVAEIATTFASSHNLRLEQVSALNVSDLPGNLAILVVLAPDSGAADFAAAAASVQVIAIGFTPTAEAANLQSLLANGVESGAAAFIAGYVAEMTAPDWRAGMLYSPASAQQVDDFVAGGEYFCGSCAPVAPPYNEYPQTAQAADGANWQAAADQLLAQSVNVVYIAPELETSGAAQYLASFGVLLIGSGAPPADAAANWLASVNADLVAALREQLPLALAGEQVTQSSSLVISNVNAAYLSTARLAYVQTIINDLLSGYIVLSGDE